MAAEMIDSGGGGRLIGRTISHYRVIAPLGVGGMGVVYRGEDVRLGRPVAIKFVADDFANDAQAVARLRAEARAASALNHPNICTIHDIGTEEGHPFIVMELMEGQTLRDRLVRGHLKVHELVDMGIQAADALQAAHSAGIIHRDIKPANIFITSRTHVKLLDFGLAKLTTVHPSPDSATTLATADLTVAGTTLGTVTYMSPEQAAGEELDGRTDLFSLGVVLYECATGRPPFEGKTHALVLSAILNRAPAAPTTLNHELPLRLQEIILTCLEKDRELRYQSAADVRADLKRVRRDLESGHLATGATQTIVAGSVPEIAGEPSVASHVQPPAALAASLPANQKAARSRLPLVSGGLIALVVVAAAGGFALWNRSRQEAAPVAPTTASSSPADTATVANDAIEGRLALARSSFSAGNYRAAQSYASEVLASQPTEAEALNIRRESAAALDRFEQAIALARQRLASNDVQGAARAVAEAREIDPTSPVVSELASILTQRVREPSPAPAPRGGRSPADEPGRKDPASTAGRATETVGQTPVPPPPAPAPPSPPATVAPPATAAASAGASSAPPPDSTASADRPAAPRPAPVVEKTPPPADRGTAPPQPETDDAAVRRIVASYARAIESKDVALFRSVKPNLSAEEERRLQEGFRTVTSQQVRLSPTSVEIRGQEATVVAQRRDIIDAGGRRQTVESRQTFRLTRNASGWVITDIR